MSEAEWIEQCKRGDRNALETLYKLYARKMLGVCYRYVGDEETARDIMHDGFIKIFHSLDGFHSCEVKALFVWMKRIMVNTALHYLRDCRYVDTNYLQIENLPEDMQPVDKQEISLLPSPVLMELFAGLPQGYRTVLNLFIFEGLSHKEIAETLGINEHSSSSQLYRAKRLLAERINEYLKRQEK